MLISSLEKNGKKQPFNYNFIYRFLIVYSSRGYRIILNNLHHHLTGILSKALHITEKYLYYSCNINRKNSLLFLKVKITVHVCCCEVLLPHEVT